MYKVVSFYRYSEIEAPEELMITLRQICERHNILGRILLGEEGINGAICGDCKNIEHFKFILNELFPDLTFREQNSDTNTYHKLVVRVRDEVVSLGVKSDLNNSGRHISPAKLKQMLDDKEDIILLDARNEYEAKLGKFDNAIVLPINNFKELPEAIKKRDDLKNKKIVMYCTGGIRCEKSSAYLKEQGFKDVNQLEGGIINYVNQFPNSHYKGSLYVFDDRKVSHLGDPISKCEICNNNCDLVINCHNLDCDRLFISCETCQNIMHSTCCESCKSSPNQRKESWKNFNNNSKINKKIIGKVENYYAKSKVALVRIKNRMNTELKNGDKVNFEGNTTRFEQEVQGIVYHDEGLITFPVNNLVRKNDLIII